MNECLFKHTNNVRRSLLCKKKIYKIYKINIYIYIYYIYCISNYGIYIILFCIHFVYSCFI